MKLVDPQTTMNIFFQVELLGSKANSVLENSLLIFPLIINIIIGIRKPRIYIRMILQEREKNPH